MVRYLTGEAVQRVHAAKMVAVEQFKQACEASGAITVIERDLHTVDVELLEEQITASIYGVVLAAFPFLTRMEASDQVKQQILLVAGAACDHAATMLAQFIDEMAARQGQEPGHS